MSSTPKPGLSADPNLTVDLGIGGYYTCSNLDQMFAFDYRSIGKLDHLVVYRPGSGIIWILENSGTQDASKNAVYVPVYQQGDPSAGTNGNGMGVTGSYYDLMSTADRAFAFDYEGSGKLDDLVLYRPGAGIFWILQNTAGSGNARTFLPVYAADGSTTQGIGGYKLMYPADLAFAFDYEGSGELDDLVLYRPGTGVFSILQNTAGSGNSRTFSPAYVADGATKQGIGGYNLLSLADLAFAFDYESSGKLDDLVLYRPGAQIIWVLQAGGPANARTFTLVYPAPGSVPDGIGNFPLTSPLDRALAFDYTGKGIQDHLVLYEPGSGNISIVQNDGGGNFSATLQIVGDPPYSGGLGGFDLCATADQAFSFDFAGTGNLDHLVFYRPGTGAVSILKNDRSNPATFDNSPYHVGLSSEEQVQKNLANIRSLNTSIYDQANSLVNQIYFWISSNENGTNWGESVGFNLFAGAFWALAGVVGSSAILAGAAGFAASFIPGLVAAISGGGVDTQTFAGLLATLQNAYNALDAKLNGLEGDVRGNWTVNYNGTPLSNLANTVFPNTGVTYNLLFDQMLAQRTLYLWQQVLQKSFVKTQFKSWQIVGNAPDADYYNQYYLKNPAYYLVYYSGVGGGQLAAWNIGTGVSWFYPRPFIGGGDGGMNVPACNALFEAYSRAEVFTSWPIPNANPCNQFAPDPPPPGWVQPPANR